MTEQKKRRRRPRNKKPNQGNKANSPAKANSNAAGNKTKRPQNNRKRKKPLKAGEIVLKHDNLMAQYLNIRKKYFEQFHKLRGKKKISLMNNYVRTLSDLKSFANKLKPWQKEILENERTEAFPKDLQYSSEKELPEDGAIEEGSKNFLEVHTNEVQASRSSYKDDKEESTGTIEDYKAYKEEKEAVI